MGRTVNGLKRRDGLDTDVADLARTIVRKWKDIVAKHDEQEEEAEAEEVAAINHIINGHLRFYGVLYSDPFHSKKTDKKKRAR